MAVTAVRSISTPLPPRGSPGPPGTPGDADMFPDKAAMEAFDPNGATVDFLRAAGSGAAGDGLGGDWVPVGSEPVHAAKVEDAEGNWYHPAELQPRKARREWKAEWFGVTHHLTADRTGFAQAIIDEYNPADGPVDVTWPAGSTICLNAHVSNDVEVLVDGATGMTWILPDDCEIKKTIANRILIATERVGSVPQTKLERFNIKGGRWNGGSFDDGDNDWPLVALWWAENCSVTDAHAFNFSTAFRFGDAEELTSDVHLDRLRLDNGRYNGAELSHCEKSTINDVQGQGGAMSVGSGNRMIRVSGGGSHIDILRPKAWDYGTLLALNASAGNPCDEILVEDPQSFGHTGFAAIWSQFAITNSRIVRPRILGNGSLYGIYIGAIIDVERSSNLLIEDPFIEAGASETDLIYLEDVDDYEIRGGRLSHLGRAVATSHYAIRKNTCGGLCRETGIAFDMDGTHPNPRASYDNLGLASLRLVLAANTFYMKNTANAALQVASAGTLVTAAAGGDTNTYLTRA